MTTDDALVRSVSRLIASPFWMLLASYKPICHSPIFLVQPLRNLKLHRIDKEMTMHYVSLAKLLRTPHKGNIARQIALHRVQAAHAAAKVIEHHNAITALQQQCVHAWKFSNQENNHHNELWSVMYKCPECDSTRVVITKPVCEDCDCALHYAAPDDHEAEEERRKPCHRPSGIPSDDQPPIAFRCPQCSKIHILWFLGD